MTASEVIKELQKLMDESGQDPEVGAQSHGCCPHAHSIREIEFDEQCEIVIRV